MSINDGLSVKAITAMAKDCSQPIAVLRGSVLGSRNESGGKVRNYRQKKHKSADDDSSDTESQEPSIIEQPGKADGIIAAVADQGKSNETRWVRLIHPTPSNIIS